jgi:hypothetical protein
MISACYISRIGKGELRAPTRAWTVVGGTDRSWTIFRVRYRFRFAESELCLGLRRSVPSSPCRQLGFEFFQLRIIAALIISW